MLSILLIDDDPYEDVVARKTLGLCLGDEFDLIHVPTCDDGLERLSQQVFDLVMLDNRLTSSMTAETSVPMLKSSSSHAPIAIISNDVEPDYLAGPEILDVDYVVDKRDMVSFLTNVSRRYLANDRLSDRRVPKAPTQLF